MKRYEFKRKFRWLYDWLGIIVGLLFVLLVILGSVAAIKFLWRFIFG